MSVTRIIGGVQTGDVFHLDAVAPASGWTTVAVASLGGQGPGIFASFRAADLVSGSWAWNQTGAFIGTFDVEHCELDEEHVR